MSTHPPTPLLSPRPIIVAGANPKRDTFFGDMLNMIRRSGFVSAIHPINPNHAEIAGRRYASFADLLEGLNPWT